MTQSRQQILSDITSKIYTSTNHIITVPILQNVLMNIVQNMAVLQETYTKSEVKSLVKKITSFRFQVVPSLPEDPETNVLYLVGETNPEPNVSYNYEEWVYDATKAKPWVKIGNTNDECPVENGSGVGSIQVKGYTGKDVSRAIKDGAISLGKGCISNNEGALSTGDHTVSNGVNSFTQGYKTVAKGDNSISAGSNTKTNNENEFACGKWNKSNSSKDDNLKSTLYSIGIGTSEGIGRSNAVEVMQSGDVYIKGLGGFNGKNANADNVETLVDAVNGKYSKPKSGIPLDDLSEEVKEAIDKVNQKDDTELYRKPIKGIPASDFTPGVRKLLDKANKSLQPSDIPLKRGLVTDNPDLVNLVLDGVGATAEGVGSIALGPGCESNADNAFTCGTKNYATNPSEVAVGQYNKSHTSTDREKATAFSVGIGECDEFRRNAIETAGNGEVYIIGIGGYDGTNAGDDGVLSLQEALRRVLPDLVDCTKYFK